MQGEGVIAVPAGGACVVVSGGTCAVVIGAGAVAGLAAYCLNTPSCGGAVAEAGGAALEALGDAKEWFGGLFSKGHSRLAEPNFTPWYPSSSEPGQYFPPGFRPPSGGPAKWMYNALRIGAIAAVLKTTGVLDAMCMPPKESKEMK
jgi:hypothetical protein